MPCDERVFWTDVVGNALEIALLILVFVAIWRAGTLLRSCSATDQPQRHEGRFACFEDLRPHPMKAA